MRPPPESHGLPKLALGSLSFRKSLLELKATERLAAGICEEDVPGSLRSMTSATRGLRLFEGSDRGAMRHTASGEQLQVVSRAFAIRFQFVDLFEKMARRQGQATMVPPAALMSARPSLQSSLATRL